MLGLEFLHSHGWLHGDLKPGNIGFIGASSRAVLLDLGTACYLEPGHLIEPTPGKKGTIRYQAPERELEGYEHSIDIWAIGVIGVELLYGHHPWHMERNPWRQENEDLREEYCEKYEATMTDLEAKLSNSNPIDAGEGIQRKLNIHC